MGIELIVAMVAGFVSFISPCVLPLVPAYIGYMGGRVTHTVSTQMNADGTATASRPLSLRFNTFLHGLAFVIGFTMIFVFLGIIGTAFLQTFGSTTTVESTVGRVGGMLIIFFGLQFAGVISWAFRQLRKNGNILASPLFSALIALIGSAMITWGFTGTLQLWNADAYPFWSGIITLALLATFLTSMVLGGAFIEPAKFWDTVIGRLEYMLNADTRPQMQGGENASLLSSAFMGVVFAAGWSPCIGPTLGVALTLAANDPSGADIARSAQLMAAYSLGLGIPFLITALLLDSAQGGLRRMTRHMNTIKLVSGAFLVFIGYTIANGDLQRLSLRFSQDFGDFSYRVEECAVGLVEGDIALHQVDNCVNDDPDFFTLVGINEGRINADTLEPLEGEDNETETSAIDTVIADDTIADDTIADSTSSDSEGGDNPLMDAEIGLAVGNLAPNFTTTTIDGETISLWEQRGQVVLLNFWYTSCGPCQIEMPEFENAYQQYNDDGLTILAVNREESAADISAFAEDMGGLSFPLLLDEDGDIQFEYGIGNYPTTYIIDENGVIVYRNFGAITVEQIQELVAEYVS